MQEPTSANRIAATIVFLSFAMVTLASAQLAHHYPLDSSFIDVLGGPDVVADGGTLEHYGGYSFGPNQGLRIFGASVAPDQYTIELDLSVDYLESPWVKILDLSDRTLDSGL